VSRGRRSGRLNETKSRERSRLIEGGDEPTLRYDDMTKSGTGKCQ
jgi:hypothetical protein